MNFKKMLLGTAMLGVVAATFGFTNARRVTFVAFKIGTVCSNAFGYAADQPTCSPLGTGPQCTVTLNNVTYPALQQGTTPACSVPMYVFNP